MRSATYVLALLLAALTQPATAQTFAPAPRAVAPATVAHPCMAPPQGQGPTSAECKRECERNPQATQCPRPAAATAPAAAPNWGALPGAAPAPATGAAPQSMGAPAQFGDGSVRQPAVPNANTGALKLERIRSGAPGAGPAQPSGVSAPTPPAPPRSPGPAPTVDPGPPGGTPIRLPNQPATATGANARAPLRTPIAGPSQADPGQTATAVPSAIAAPGAAPSSAGSAAAAGGNPPPASGGAPAAASRGPTMTVAPALAPQASSTLPGSQPPSRRDPAATVARLGCGPHLAMGGEPYLSAVDGQAKGVVFTPGKTFTLQGCGFGTRKGTVALNGSSGLSNLLLLVQSWNDTTIVAQVDPKLGGVMDQAQVEVVVSLRDGKRLQQSGHVFEAARETIKLVSLPPGVVRREGPNLVRPMPKVVSPAPSGATLLVDTPPYAPDTQFCPSEPNRDVLTLTAERLPLRNGFAIDRVVGRDLTNRDWERGDHGEDSHFEWHRQNAFTIESNPPYAQIVPSWMGLYHKRDALRELMGAVTFGATTAISMALDKGKLAPGFSLCWSAYEVDVYVKGPRGLAAF